MRVTQEMIVRMNDLYLELKTYAAVARKIGVSPTTVKRYINPNYKRVKDGESEDENELEITIQPINYELFDRPSWNILLTLMPREVDGMLKLREEVVF